MNLWRRRKKILKFRGVPREGKSETLSRWQKFLTDFMPWIQRKKDQGEMYLSLELAQRHANTIKTLAEADLIKAQAEKTRVETNDLRQEGKAIADKSAKVEIELQNDEEIQEMTAEEMQEELNSLIKVAYLKYGLRVEFNVEEAEKETEYVYEEEFDLDEEEGIRP